jgi:hypothetical protein
VNEPVGIGGHNEGCFVNEDRKRKKVGEKRVERRKEGQKGKGKEAPKGQLSVGSKLGQVTESMTYDSYP